MCGPLFWILFTIEFPKISQFLAVNYHTLMKRTGIPLDS